MYTGLNRATIPWSCLRYSDQLVFEWYLDFISYNRFAVLIVLLFWDRGSRQIIIVKSPIAIATTAVLDL